jgi:N-acyl-D-amino-acid deacylase
MICADEISALDGILTGSYAMSAFELVIRNGTVVDGSGGEPFIADVAVAGGRIVGIGAVAGKGREEIDARDRIVR